MSNIGWDDPALEPERYEPDEDFEYDRYRQDKIDIEWMEGKMVTLSEKAQAVLALEKDRTELFEQAQKLTYQQFKIMADAASQLVGLSKEQALILEKMAALDQAERSIFNGA